MSCATAGCGKPSWNGQPGEYCSKSCRHVAASATAHSGPICQKPGCGKPTWNGLPDEYCSKSCKATGPTVGVCLREGCGKPTWNGQPGEYCAKSCKSAAVTKKSGGFCTKVSSSKFQELEHQLKTQWRGSPCPAISQIIDVTQDKLKAQHEAYAVSIGNVKVYGCGANPGNKQRRFHSTKKQCKGWKGKPCKNKKCPLCSIIRNGFDTRYSQVGRFGLGLYSSSTPSKAFRYGDPMYLFIVSVVCGNAEYTDSCHINNTTELEPQFHSRVIRDTGGGNDECIVFRNEAMIPRYLLIFAPGTARSHPQAQAPARKPAACCTLQ